MLVLCMFFCLVGLAVCALGSTGTDGRCATYLRAVRAEPAKRFRLRDGRIEFVVPDPGKHIWNNLIAHLAETPDGSTPLSDSPVTVRQMADTLFRFPNLFHFNADGPAVCLYRWPGLVAPDVRQFFFEGHNRSVFDHAGDPVNNLFTSEGTENHLAMARFPGYLFCQHWLVDHPDDRRALDGLAKCREYILLMNERTRRAGRGEWNSSTYYGYQLRGILTCFDHATDPEVRHACKSLLDFFATEMALSNFHGVNARPEMRGSARSALVHEPDQIAWLWFGGAGEPTTATSAVYAAISSYRPPESLHDLAHKRPPYRGTMHVSHASYLQDRIAQSRETILVDESYMLASADLPYAGLTGASSQFQPWKLAVRTEAGPWVMVGNSTARNAGGNGRSPWDQWVQHENVLIQLTRVPSNAADLLAAGQRVMDVWRDRYAVSHRRRWGFAPDPVKHLTWSDVQHADIASYLTFDAERVTILPDALEGAVLLQIGGVNVIVRSLHQPGPQVSDSLDGKSAGKTTRWLIDRAPLDRLSGFVIELSASPLDELLGRAVAGRVMVDDKTRQVTYRDLLGRQVVATYGLHADAPLTEPVFDWGYIVDPRQDEPRPTMSKPPIEQPTFPLPGESLEGWGRIARLTVDGRPIERRGVQDDAVFDGPGVLRPS